MPLKTPVYPLQLSELGENDAKCYQNIHKMVLCVMIVKFHAILGPPPPYLQIGGDFDAKMKQKRVILAF